MSDLSLMVLGELSCTFPDPSRDTLRTFSPLAVQQLQALFKDQGCVT